ncbi:MAG: PAS domain-containing protein, partial [Planctomycetota bacterium]
MCDSRKTKKALIEELQTLRSRLAELERVEGEHKRAEAALRESEQRYARAEQIGHFGHFERDLVEDKATWSRESYRLFGVDPDQFEPSYENFLNLVHPADRHRVESAFVDTISHGKPFDIEYRIVRPDGAERVVHSVAEVRFDESGRPVKLVGTALDITERKQAEQVLRKARDELEARVQERTATLSRTNELLKEQAAERKEAEATMGSQKALLDDIITNIPAFVFWKDKRSVYLGCNDNFAKLAGLEKPEDIVGKTDYDLPWRKSESDFYRKIDEEVMRSGLPQLNFEEPLHLADGTAATILTSKVPIRNVDGVVDGILGIFWDITEPKQAEQALRGSEHRFRSLVETSSDWVWEIDQNNIYTYASPKVKDLLGYEPEEVVGKTPFDLMPLDEAERVTELFNDIVESRKPFDRLENTNLHKDGRVVVLETSGVPILGEGGNLLGYRGIDRDITERKKAEAALRESEYKGLFQGSAEGILVADSQTREFKYANPAMCRMLGYTEKEFKLMGVRDIHPEEDLERVISEFEAQARGEKTLSLGIPCLRKDGTIVYADINTASVVIDGRKCNVGFFTDITERKKTEDELLFKSTLLEAQSETSIDGILVVDGEGKSILFNKRFGQMWNIPQKILDTGDDEKMLQYVLDQLKDPNRFLEKVTYLYAHKNEKSRDE